MVNNTSSSCKNCMVLIRKLVLKGLCENVRIFAKYIESSENLATDFLSRGKMKEFYQLSDQWDDRPTVVPTELENLSQIWLR